MWPLTLAFRGTVFKACSHEKRVPLGGRGTLPCRVNDTGVLHEKFSQGGGALPPRVKSKQIEAHDTNKDGGSTEYHGCESNCHLSFISSGRFSVKRIIIDIFIIDHSHFASFCSPFCDILAVKFWYFPLSLNNRFLSMPLSLGLLDVFIIFMPCPWFLFLRHWFFPGHELSHFGIHTRKICFKIYSFEVTFEVTARLVVLHVL